MGVLGRRLHAAYILIASALWLPAGAGLAGGDDKRLESLTAALNGPAPAEQVAALEELERLVWQAPARRRQVIAAIQSAGVGGRPVAAASAPASQSRPADRSDWRPKAVAVLVPCLLDPDPAIRAEAARTLGTLGAPEGVGPLTPRVRDEDPRVREAAIRAMGAVGSQAAVGPLGEAFARESVVLRLAVVESIAPGARSAMRPILVRALGDPDDGVALAALKALSEAPGADMVEALAARIQRLNLIPRQGFLSAGSLSRIGGPKATAALIAGLRAPTLEVRVSAAFFLEAIGGPEVISALAKAAGDSDLAAAQEALFVLARLDSKAALKPFVALMARGTPAQQALALAVGNTGQADLFDALLALFKHEDHALGGMATHFLGEIGGRRVVALLKPMAKDLGNRDRWNLQAAIDKTQRKVWMMEGLQKP